VDKGVGLGVGLGVANKGASREGSKEASRGGVKEREASWWMPREWSDPFFSVIPAAA
jgi:hypothetical protein